MTEETQALVRQLREWVDGQSVTYASVLMQDAAAALATLARDLAQTKEAAEVVYASSKANAEEVQRLARDLETARQERDAALESAHYANGVADLAMKHRDVAESTIDAAGQPARAETLRELRRKISEEANFVYEALIIIDRAAREGQ